MFISNFPKTGILLQDCAWETLVFTYLFSNFNRAHRFGNKSALQIRAGQRLITANLRPLTAHIYHVMIAMAGGFSKKFFLLTLFLFLRNPFE